MSMTGADTAALDQMAGRLNTAAEQIDRMAALLQRNLSAPWHGSDAATFRSDWSRSHRPALGQVTVFLRDGSRQLYVHAAEQRVASGAAGPADMRLLISDAVGDGAGNLSDLFSGGPADQLVAESLMEQRVDALQNLLSIAGAGMHFIDEPGALNAFAILPSGFSLIASALPPGGWRLGAEGLTEAISVGLDVHGAMNFVAPAGALAKAVPIVSAVGGAITLWQDGKSFLDDPNAVDGFSALGGGLTMVGGVMVASGVGAPIGAALMAAGTVASATSWTIENWDAISDVGRDVYAGADRAVDWAAREADELVDRTLDGVKDGVGGALKKLGGLF